MVSYSESINMTMNSNASWSRRAWLNFAAGGLAAIGHSRWGHPLAMGDDIQRSLIIRNRHPIDLETPVTALDGWVTGNDDFFVRSHLGEPAAGLAPWSLNVGGLVDKTLHLSLDDLKSFEQVTIPAVLQCAGNGRAYFKPLVPGIPWEKGAVGHAEWTGVRLVDLLKKAGLAKTGAHVHFLGADAPPSPKTPAYFRSIPIERALDPATLLATSMNGVPLPLLHGGPIRLVVPCWTGNHWMKWVRSITAADTEAPGLYNQSAYKLPKSPVAPDVTPKPEDLVPVTLMNVKSLITAPADQSRLKFGLTEVRGVAWTGNGFVNKVEISTNLDPAWKIATLLDGTTPGSWRRWTYLFELPKTGKVVVRARAADSNGEVQPESTPWNKSGYLWNAIDFVTLEIG